MTTTITSEKTGKTEKAAETVQLTMPWGKYKGYPIDSLIKHRQGYLAYFVAKYDGKHIIDPDLRELIEYIKPLISERQVKIKKEHIQINKDKEWLIEFLSAQQGAFFKNVAKQLRGPQLFDKKLNRLSHKQLTVLADKWAEVKGGPIGTKEYIKARKQFQNKMRPFWFRKYVTVDDI